MTNGGETLNVLALDGEIKVSSERSNEDSSTMTFRET